MRLKEFGCSKGVFLIIRKGLRSVKLVCLMSFVVGVGCFCLLSSPQLK